MSSALSSLLEEPSWEGRREPVDGGATGDLCVKEREVDVDGDTLVRRDKGEADEAEGEMGVATTRKGAEGRAATETGEMAIGGVAEAGVAAEAGAEAEAEPAAEEVAGADGLDWDG